MEKDRREEERGGGSLRGTIHDLYATLRKGSLVLLLLVPGPSRFLDFRVFSNLRIENSWAGSSVVEGRTRANQRREGRGIPFQKREPFQKRRATPWMASDLCDYNRKRKKKKRNCARWHLVLSPLFIPHPPLVHSSFFLPRCQLLPEWRNLAVTWLSKTTSCIFSWDFRIASQFLVFPSFAADVIFLFL